MSIASVSAQGRLALLSLAWCSLADAAPAVEISRVEQREIAPTVIAAGQVQSRSGADMAAGVGGQLAWVAEPGTRLKRGEVIARIVTDEMELLRAEQAARVTRGEIGLKQAERELERQRAAGNAVSRYQLDQTENARDLARSDLDIARSTLRQTDERLSRARITAPFGGVVSERLHRAGEEVARGDVIARLSDPEHLEIRLFLPLRHVRAISAGSVVHVLAEEGAADAHVRAVVPVGDARTQSFEVLVDVPAGPRHLDAGRSLRVELPLEAARQTLAVPRDALIIRSEGMAVYRIKGLKPGKLKPGEPKTVERIVVKPGLSSGSWVAVEGSLAPQDAVVVRGGESLHDGDSVNIIGERDA